MADLHAKLSMRRRGISGAERSGGSVLHTLAYVIPEPESTSQRSSSEEDWEWGIQNWLGDTYTTQIIVFFKLSRPEIIILVFKAG